MNTTGSKPYDHALPHDEERYRLLFDSNPHPVWVYDSKTLAILDANESALSNYGYSREEFLSLTIKDLRPAGDIPRLVESVAQAHAGTESAGIWRHRKKDGGLLDVEITSHSMVYGGREARLVVATDVTERLGAEEALRQSEERFRLMVSAVKGYAILMLDPEGRVISWNAGAERIKGYRAEEIMGQHFSRFYPAEAIAAGTPSLALKVAADEGRFEDEGWRLRKDGSRFWANVVITALRDEQGQLRGFSKVTRDMTERKRFEDALKESETRLNIALDSAQMGVWELDLRTDTSVRSLRHDQIFGYSTLQPRWGVDTFLPHVLPQDQELARDKLAEALRTGHLDLECRIVWADRTVHWIAAQGQVYQNHRGEPIKMVGVVSESTGRKRAEQEILLRTTELEAANKELEAFSYSVSHDLRAPLRGIDGFSQALLEDYAERLDQTGKNYLQRIRAATQRMGMLIDDLLTLSQVTRAEMHRESIDLSQLAGSIAAELFRAQPGRRADFQIAPGLEAEGDARLIRVVLQNLLENAWKFTSRREHALIEFGKSHANGKPAFFVKDNGAGFDPAHSGRLFGAFQRLHSMADFPGTGIGLATVQRILHRHGGQVWATGAVDEGATIFFTV
ncbi:MAG TPA: PAS domain S-box protein [Candidatus Acidoferrum sp.]|jgi:PAS domain S-box-containing protein|nr:PAS domain S-box protein [Candidatus Acidoferrum sp.]